MSLDKSKITPEDFYDAYADSSLHVEGRDEMLEMVRSEFPEETRYDGSNLPQSDEEKIGSQLNEQGIFDPNSEVNQNLPSPSESFNSDLQLPQVADIPGAENLTAAFEQPNQEEQPVQKSQEFNEEERIRFKTDLPLDAREETLAKQLKSRNLDETLSAFKQINSDPELTARFDTNGDGVFSFKDMFWTSRFNNGQGLSKQEDLIQTQRWLESVSSKDLKARVGAFLMNIPLFHNKTEFMIEGRRQRLAPIEDVFLADDNLAAGAFEWTKDTLNFPDAAAHFITGGILGSDEGNRLGDRLLNSSNKESMAYHMMTPAKRHWSDSMWHEIAYWGPEALMIATTMGLGANVTASKQAMNLPKGKRLMLAANKFLTQKVTSGKVVKTVTKGGIKTTVVPATTKLGKLKNLGFSLSKAGFVETARLAAMRDLTLAELNGLYVENSWVKN